MSHERPRRRRNRPAQPAPATPPRSSSTSPEAQPRRARHGARSNLAVVFALFAGLFLGRVATENVAPGALGLLDLIMYAALAACVAIAFRRWARRNVEERRRQQLRRRGSSRDEHGES